jgi:ferredoxin--NADP+ reductase
MHKILHKEQLSENVFLMRLSAPLIAGERQPGQFVILSVEGDLGERIPLTIADADAGEGSVTIIFQRVGRTTDALAKMDPGESVSALLGPLGTPTHIDRFGTVVCVGGGIGVAPLHPIVQGLKAAGNRIITVLGARNKELVILEDRMRALSDELIVCTDDGSYGRKALVTEPLKEICAREPKPDLAVAIGPPVMMKFCAETTRPYGVHTLVSLNTIMVDGTGMCGGCRVSVGDETKFVCVDGPEFDGHQVDWKEMMTRMRAYIPQEQQSLKIFHDKCKCETHQLESCSYGESK